MPKYWARYRKLMKALRVLTAWNELQRSLNMLHQEQRKAKSITYSFQAKSFAGRMFNGSWTKKSVYDFQMVIYKEAQFFNSVDMSADERFNLDALYERAGMTRFEYDLEMGNEPEE